MMITKLTGNVREIVDQNNGIKLYLESLERRVDFTPRSWLYDGEKGNPFLDPNTILHKWSSILQNALTNAENLKRLGLTEDAAAKIVQFDTMQIAKWGPQGGHAPMSELFDEVVAPSFQLASNPEPRGFKSHFWQKAMKLTIRDLTQKVGKRTLRPASYESVVDDMRARDTLESNSGIPDFKRRNIEEVKTRAIDDAESGAWKQYPAIALFRTYNGKTRLVWMYPMSTNLVEGAFFQPLMSALMRADDPNKWFRRGYSLQVSDMRELSDPDVDLDTFFCPWRGFEDVRIAVTSAMAAEYNIAASDFSSTDAHFQKWATMQVYECIKHCFQQQYWAALKESLMHMHEIPLIIGPDSMVTGDHGVSSGSNWTNFVETVFDRIFAYYLNLKGRATPKILALNLKIDGLYAIGDDQSYRYTSAARNSHVETMRVKEFIEACGKEIGQDIKAEKTTADPDSVKTLQRLFLRGYSREDKLLRGVYPTIRALKSSVYPERFHKASLFDSDMFCMRQFMILENCVDHPLFNEFVEFVCKGNRHLIPFAKKSRGQLEAIQRRSKLVPGLNSTYNQEKRDQSIADFESIRVASNL